MAGYIKDYRQELESDIWLMPPLYHRVWQYLKYKVNHDHGEVPFRDGTSVKINPGQHLTSIREIAKGVSWYERRVLKTPNPKTIDTILKWLAKKNMISITHGNGNSDYTMISLINWAIYQYEHDKGNAKVTEGKQLLDTNNNDQKELRITPITSADFFSIIDEYCKLHKKFEYHVNNKERTLMNRMIAGGMPVPFIIRIMNQTYEDKRIREQEDGGTFSPPSSFLYYESPIFEAWNNVQSITDSVPSEPVALGQPKTRKKYQSNRGKPVIPIISDSESEIVTDGEFQAMLDKARRIDSG